MPEPRRLSSLAPARIIDPAFPAEARLDALLSVYRESRDKIAKQLRRVDLTTAQRRRQEQMLRQVRAEVKYLNTYARKWSGKSAEVLYESGWRAGVEMAKELQVYDPTINLGARLNTQAVQAMADQMAIDLQRANNTIAANVENYIRRTQQMVVDEAILDQTIAEGVLEGKARRTVSDQLLAQFRERLGENQFITINGKNYDPAKYAELLARTRMREAATQGTIASLASSGTDLVQIDVHGDACPLCRTRMGRVYSISGQHPDFPVLDARPPYHPNCECVLMAVNETILRRRGQYDALVELGKGPAFTKEKDAAEWLAKNPGKNIATITDYRAYLKGAAK